MTISEVLEKIHEFSRFGSKLGLERMNRLLKAIGNPQQGLRIVHVTGTNGKGSVCRYVYSILQNAGYKTGLYTSPFLERFSERIEFNGSEISDNDLIEAFEVTSAKVKEMVELGFESPTEFELITAMAFWYFKKQNADVVVLEVGLGGRGDSTNVIKAPLVTAITSVSYDHTEQLGETLSQIAYNKAGIIKPGVPIVSFAEDPKSIRVISAEAETNGSRVITQKDYRVSSIKKNLSGYTFSANVLGTRYDHLKISMIGEHQIQNACCALCMIEYLRKNELSHISIENVYRGLEEAVQKGRFEVFKTNPTIVIDGAHNIAGVKMLVNTVKDHFSNSKLLVLSGILRDKQVDKMTAQLQTLNADFVLTEPDNPRKLAAEKLAEYFDSSASVVTVKPSIDDAWKYINEVKEKYDAVICTGSLYLIGHLRSLITKSL